MIVSLLAAMLALPQAEAPAPAATPTPVPEKQICRRETYTSSNLMKRVCHTRAEWAAINAGTAEGTETVLRARRLLAPGGRVDD